MQECLFILDLSHCRLLLNFDLSHIALVIFLFVANFPLGSRKHVTKHHRGRFRTHNLNNTFTVFPTCLHMSA